MSRNYDEDRPHIDGANRWVRSETDVAARIEVGDLKGLLRRGVVVEAGTKALLFSDGRLEAQLGGGRYELSTASEKLRNLAGLGRVLWVVLVDEAGIRLPFQGADLETQNQRLVSAEAHLVLQIEDPRFFYQNLIRSQTRITSRFLQQRYGREMQDALSEYVSGHMIGGLNAHQQTKDEIRVRLDRHLRSTLRRDGLRLEAVESVAWDLGAYAEVLQEDRDASLDRERRLREAERIVQDLGVDGRLHQEKVKELQQRIAHARENRDVLGDAELEGLEAGIRQELAKEGIELDGDEGRLGLLDRKISHRQRRADLMKQLRHTLMEEKKGEAADKFDMAAFQHKLQEEAERNQLLEADRMKGLRHRLSLDGIERLSERRQREHAETVLQVEEQFQLDMLELERQGDLDEREAKRQADLLRQKAEGAWSLAIDKRKHEIELQKLQDDVDAAKAEEQRIRDLAAQREAKTQELNLALADAQNEVEIKRLKFQLEKEEDYHDQDLIDLATAREIKEEKEKALLRFEAWAREAEKKSDLAQKELDRRLQLMQEEQRQRIESLRAESEAERERLKVISAMPIQALISEAGAEQAAILRSLQQDEAFKDMTEEQILAASLKDLNPAQAEAWKVRAEGGKVEAALLARERELAEERKRDAEAARQEAGKERDEARREREDQRRDADRHAEEVGKIVKDAAKGVADAGSKGGSGPIIVTGGGGGPVTVPQGGGSAPPAEDGGRRCPGCGLLRPSGDKFCTECGEHLTD